MVVRRDTGRCPRWAGGIAASGSTHQRHFAHRFVFVLPISSAAWCCIAGPRHRCTVDPDRRAVICRWALEQLRHALDCHGHATLTQRAPREGFHLGEWWLCNQTCLRCVCDAATSQRLSPRISASRNRRTSPSRTRPGRRCRWRCNHRGILRNA